MGSSHLVQSQSFAALFCVIAGTGFHAVLSRVSQQDQSKTGSSRVFAARQATDGLRLTISQRLLPLIREGWLVRVLFVLIHSPLGFQQMVLCLLWLAPSLFLRMDSREYIVRPKKTEIPMAPHLELRSLWFILPAVTAITLNEK